MRKPLIFASGVLAGWLGSTIRVESESRKKFHTSPDWLANYTQRHQFKQSAIYETYIAFSRMRTTFFENQVMENIRGYDYFKIYQSQDPQHKDKLICVFNANENMCFHQKVVHGGASSLLMDTLFGYLSVFSTKSLVATATLKIDYKKPIVCNRYYMAEVEITKREGKKIWVSGDIYPLTEELCSQNKDVEPLKANVHSQALMISVNWSRELQDLIGRVFSKQ